MELSPDCAEFQSGESDTSSRRASFEDDAIDKLDVKTLDDALELKSSLEVIYGIRLVLSQSLIFRKCQNPSLVRKQRMMVGVILRTNQS